MNFRTDYRKNKSELMEDTYFLLRDQNMERYSSDDIATALNDACMEFALRTKIVKDEINVQVKEHVSEYDIKTRIEEDGTKRTMGFPIRIGYDGDNEPGLWPTSIMGMDFFGYKRSDRVMPSYWFMSIVSPGKIQIVGDPQSDGETPPSEDGNLQVRYIGLPEYITNNSDYPDSHIPADYHKAFPYKAAALLLEHGDEEDLAMADQFEIVFENAILTAIGDEYKGQSPYEEVRPM